MKRKEVRPQHYHQNLPRLPRLPPKDRAPAQEPVVVPKIEGKCPGCSNETLSDLDAQGLVAWEVRPDAEGEGGLTCICGRCWVVFPISELEDMDDV